MKPLLPPYDLRVRVLRSRGPEELEYLPDARLSVDEEGRVRSLEPFSEGAEAVDMRGGHVLTPGYVDTHLHFPQTRCMGRATGPLLDWLATSIFPEESRFASEDYAREVARVFVGSLLQAGTTDSLIYGSVHAEACAVLFETLDESGLRGVAGPALMERDAPEQLCRGVDESLAGLESLRSRWHGAARGRLRLAVLPRFALSCEAELLREAGRFANDHELLVSTHIAETRREYELACQRFGAPDYLEVYERFDLVHERTVLAHCIYLSPSEWRRLVAARTVVAHCPDSNDFLGSGSMPTAAVLDGGARVALGSDVAAGRGFTMATHAAAAYDNGLRRGRRLSAARLFWWLTQGGSEALGNPESGRLEHGQWADMALRPCPTASEDLEAVASRLLFDPACASASVVWVAGKPCVAPQA